ncbi:MAG: translation initiation factor IF-2 [Alphaproteobacteria bacterium]|nr:translation initiation factor IF-2 [Alphaproteobacteria bacterium]
MDKQGDKKKTLSLGSGKLTLGGVSNDGAATPPVRGSGRASARSVQVEVVRKRQPGVRPAPSRKAAAEPAPVETPEVAEAAPPPAATDNLTETERAARNRALQEGLKKKPEPSATPVSEAAPATAEPEVAAEPEAAAEPEVQKTPAELRRQRELDELNAINKLEEDRRAENTKRHAAEQARREASAPREDASTPFNNDPASPSSRAPNRRREVPDQPKKQTTRRGTEDQRRRGKITITEALDGGDSMRQRSLASVRRAREREKARMRSADASPKVKQVRDVTIPDAITVQELSNRMAERAADVIKELMKLGIMATVTQTIDAETAELIVTELGHKPNRVSEADVDIISSDDADDASSLKPRPPVVTVMGHVDHGKTSILDAIRAADVAAGESGGITQHIGAYQVNSEAGNTITFIDTPGHEAFTEMRMRGANITDIVILVVAADDGVMQQTIEAINHARAADCPVIIAVNKCDKPEADPQRVRNELLSHEIVTEDFGGDVLCVDVSAHTKMGLDKLEEAVMLQAELLELKANPDRSAEGAVIEAKVERGRGSVASLLVTRGTLNVGDIFVVGAETGRVRAMYDDHGKQVKTATPGDAVEVLGLNGTPMAGDLLTVVDSDARAREVSEYRQRVLREKDAASGARGSVEQMLSAIAAGEAEELPVVIKTDVHGSLEAIRVAIDKLATDQVKVRILSAGVGAISESDISLAAASQGMIIAFNVRANPQARDQARRDGIEIRYHSIIYELIDEIKAAMSGLLSPETKESFIGYAEILEVFNITKVGKIAGCKVTEGTIKRGCSVRLLRDNVVIHEGSLKTLKRFKDEVKDVIEGQECGMAFENYHDLMAGDVIECFEVQEIARTLD